MHFAYSNIHHTYRAEQFTMRVRSVPTIEVYSCAVTASCHKRAPRDRTMYPKILYCNNRSCQNPSLNTNNARHEDRHAMNLEGDLDVKTRGGLWPGKPPLTYRDPLFIGQLRNHRFPHLKSPSSVCFCVTRLTVTTYNIAIMENVYKMWVEGKEAEGGAEQSVSGAPHL
jgi:hypothetical protein